MGKFKIRIFQRVVPEYRVALFDGLAERYPNSVEVVASEGYGGEDKSWPLRSAKFDYNHRMLVLGPIRWQTGLSTRGLKRGDVVVVSSDIHYVSSLWLALRAKLRGISVVWWGHHISTTSKPLGVKIRFALMYLLRVDAVLLYTKQGIAWMHEHGYDHPNIFATGNTVDQTLIEREMKYYDTARLQEWQDKNHVSGKNMILFCSVIKDKTRLEQLIEALTSKEWSLNNVMLAIIGDGPSREKYSELAKSKGVSDRIIWVGATRDQHMMAPWFLSSKLFVYPGAVGLSVLHAMSYGLPVVLNDNPKHNGPEYEAFKPGENGFAFQENNVSDLIHVVATALNKVDDLKRMGECAKSMVKSEYSMTSMINNYCEAIEAARQ